MPKSNSSSRISHSRANQAPHRKGRFLCRLCQRPHPLRLCRKFLDMTMADRLNAVRRHKYCVNCLAHGHSHGTCFSDRGCHHCHKFHHTLLHVNPKLRDQLLPGNSSSRSQSRSVSPQPSTSTRSNYRAVERTRPAVSSQGSLTSLIHKNTIILLPTVLVRIDAKVMARCLLDSGSLVSRIARGFADKHKIARLTLREETICALTLYSRHDSSVKIEGTFRVDNRIAMKTPLESLPEDYHKHFPHLLFADPDFHKSAGIDIVIGVDLYPRVMSEGVYSRSALPTAQSTIFGWAIYGSFFLFCK